MTDWIDSMVVTLGKLSTTKPKPLHDLGNSDSNARRVLKKLERLGLAYQVDLPETDENKRGRGFSKGWKKNEIRNTNSDSRI
jgi:hypothetical protein